MTPKEIIREALLLMNSMILCGEEHSVLSSAAFNQALEALDKLPDTEEPS